MDDIKFELVDSTNGLRTSKTVSSGKYKDMTIFKWDIFYIDEPLSTFYIVDLGAKLSITAKNSNAQHISII